MFWMQLLAVMGAALIIWVLFQYIRKNPQAFSAATLNKSFYTMGILALALIGFIFLCIIILKSTS